MKKKSIFDLADIESPFGNWLEEREAELEQERELRRKKDFLTEYIQQIDYDNGPSTYVYAPSGRFVGAYQYPKQAKSEVALSLGRELKWLWNGSDELMTHEEFIKRTVYHYGEGRYQITADWYAWSMQNEGKKRPTEERIYSSRSNANIKNKKRYQEMANYYQNGHTHRNSVKKAQMQAIISANLLAITGISKDVRNGEYNWFGQWYAVRNAQFRHHKDKGPVIVFVIYKSKGNPMDKLKTIRFYAPPPRKTKKTDPKYAEKQERYIKENANWSVNSFFDIASEISQVDGGTAVELRVYNSEQNLLETIQVPKGKDVKIFFRENFK